MPRLRASGRCQNFQSRSPERRLRSCLEVDSYAKLHATRRPRTGVLARQRTPTSGIAGVEVVARRVEELVMVEHVQEDDLELGVNPLGDVELLAELQVDVPVGHAPRNAPAAIVSIESQNRLTNIHPRRLRIGKYVLAEVTGSSDAARTAGGIA